MSGRKAVKRKMEEAQEEGPKSSKVAKESVTDTGTGEAEPLSHLTLETLSEDLLSHHHGSLEEDDVPTNKVSARDASQDGRVSQGTMWTGDVSMDHSHDSRKVLLICQRETKDDRCECATQTAHFVMEQPRKGSEASKRATLASLNLKTVKAAKSKKVPKGSTIKCSMPDCDSMSGEVDPWVSFVPVPGEETQHEIWTQMLDIPEGEAKGEQLYICTQHLISPAKLAKVKGKTRKKKTCDMLLAEEAEKIKVGLAGGRPKRTPKPNKHYDWAELIPIIKSEPQDPDDLELDDFMPKTPVQPAGFPGRKRKQLLATLKKEEKEDEELDPLAEEEEEEMYESEVEEYGEDVSLPGQPRPPPPKPKGRPPRIRDMCTQTDAMRSASLRLPLREVKVQCNFDAEPLSSCSNCSSVDWERLEALVAECLPQISRDMCDPVIAQCIRQVLSSVQTPTHATNFLKLLCDDQRDEIESPKGIILVSSQDECEEVEIEKMIHPEVEEPISGVKEILPKTWRRRTTVKVKHERTEELMEEEADDSLGLQEATEMDDDEFRPGQEAGDEVDPEELDDDEDWDVKNVRSTGGSPVRKKHKRVYHRVKKEEMLEAEEAEARQETSSPGDHDDAPGMDKRSNPPGRRRRTDGDMRWIRQEHRCNECDMVFTTQRKFDLHFNHVHLGVAPWQGHHPCKDCGKIFSQKISLNVHRMFKHGAPRRYSCKKCSYEGPTKEYLKRHMKVHTDERQFVCQECGKGLKTAESYRNHMVIHTNEGRFFCEVCNKAYNHKGAYEDHMRSHQEERDYACNYCGASFKAYKHVARHIRALHLNDKRFICDVCGAQHMTGFNLKGHMKKHGDMSAMPFSYECNLCEGKFRGHDGLVAHRRVVHSAAQEPDPLEIPPTPHPTRRPVKYEYSRISSGEPVKNEDTVETIYIEDESYISFYDGRAENVIYEAYEDNVEEVASVVKEESTDDNIVERIIHVYTCSSCNTMFTSEDLLADHQQVCPGKDQGH